MIMWPPTIATPHHRTLATNETERDPEEDADADADEEVDTTRDDTGLGLGSFSKLVRSVRVGPFGQLWRPSAGLGSAGMRAGRAITGMALVVQ